MDAHAPIFWPTEADGCGWLVRLAGGVKHDSAECECWRNGAKWTMGQVALVCLVYPRTEWELEGLR